MNLTDFLKANPAQPDPVYPSDCNSCGTPEQQKTFAANVLHRDPKAPHGVECTRCFRQVICRNCFTSWKSVVLLGFHDHYCPRCSQPTNETLPALRADFIGVARRAGGVRRAAKIFEMIGELPAMERILAESDGRCKNTKQRRDSQHIEIIKAIFPSALYNANEVSMPDWDDVAERVMDHTYYGKSSTEFILMCHRLHKRCFTPAPARSAPVAPPAQTTSETPCQVAPTSTTTAVATPTRQAAEPTVATPAALPSTHSPTAACEEDRKRQRDDDTTEPSGDQMEVQPDGSSELDAGLARHAPRKEMPSTAPSPTPAPQNSILAQLQRSAARKDAAQ